MVKMKDAYILLLMDCNQDCLFCSVPKKDKYLTKEEIIRKIDKYSSEKYDQVTITGGEPTLHPDLLDVVSYVKSKNMSCRVVTNGNKLDQELIDKLIKSGVDYIAISIHTFDKELAKKLSDYEDYDIDKILKSVDYILTKTRIPLYINITVTKLNYKKIPDMCKVISEKYRNVHLINFNYVDIFGNVTDKQTIEDVGIQYYASELYMNKAFRILKKNKINFRAERIPLCYLVGFEEHSSDFNRIQNIEDPKTDFVEDRFVEITYLNYDKGKQCKFCNYNKYCYGVNKNYARIYGTKELYPIFHVFPKNKLK